MTNKKRLSTVFKSFFSRQYVPYMSTKAIIHAFLDGQYRFFNTKIGPTYDQQEISRISKNNEAELLSFFQDKRNRTYMLALSYHPFCAVRSLETHLIAVRYSNEKESFVVYGLDDLNSYRPWVVNERIVEIAVEFRKCRSIKTLYWSEFLQRNEEIMEIWRKISKYNDEPRRRKLTSLLYNNTPRTNRMNPARAKNARAKNLTSVRCSAAGDLSAVKLEALPKEEYDGLERGDIQSVKELPHDDQPLTPRSARHPSNTEVI